MTPPRPPAAPGGLRRVRAGDGDRARATSLLSDHYAHGRLDDSELDERTSRALTAVYTDELDELFVDLPGAPVATNVVRPERSTAATSRAPQRRSVVPALLVAAVLLVVLTRGGALWLLLPMWWFIGPALLGRRRAPWDGAGRGRTTSHPRATPGAGPVAVGAGSSCRRWSG